MTYVDVIAQVRSGVAQILYERDRNRIGSGSGFLVDGGLATNSHVIRAADVDAIMVRMSDADPNDPESFIRLLPEDCYEAIVYESPTESHDYALLQLDEPEFADRHRFEFDPDMTVDVGERVAFLGFPFGMAQLTAHIGYISSIHERNGTKVFQVDGSINGGNSGGPLINREGNVIGLVTRAVTGLIEQQFERLIRALQDNQTALQGGGARIQIVGIDPIEALRVSQAAMEQIARELRRSANVGIGYAYSAEYLRDDIEGR